MAQFQSSSKPTIFIFSTAYLPMIGGAELAIKEITDRMSDDFDFVLFTARLRRSLPKHERIGSVDVFRLGFGLFPFVDKLLSPFLGAYFARKFIKRGNAGLFWSMMATYTSGAPFILKILGLCKGVPVLLTLQEGDSEKHLKFSNFGLTGLSWFLAVHLSDKIQVISRYLRDFSIRMGAKPEKISVVPNGVDLDVFGREFPIEELKELRIKYNIENKHKVAVTSSRLVYKNAVDVLIKAMAEIPGEHLFVAGSGLQENELKKLALDLGLEKRTHFLGDVSHADLARLYAIAHVFVRPSRSEGLGSAFLEAMASGLVVIGTKVGGIPDFLRHGESGLFCEIDDPKDLAFKIKRVFYDQGFREKLSKNAEKDARENYSWDKISTTMGGIFYRLMNTK